MTTQQIVNDLILDNQNLVIEELMKHDECLWDELENFDEDTDVLEWWLVTPFMADMLKNNGEVILAAYDCYWWGRQTSGQGLSMDWVIQEIARQTDNSNGAKEITPQRQQCIQGNIQFGFQIKWRLSWIFHLSINT